MKETPPVRARSARTRLRELAGNEWTFVGLVILGVLVLTGIPYLYAYLSAPPGRQFMGIMLDVPDHAQYFSWMRELAAAPLASNKLTSEANPPLFFNLLWWGLGRLGRLMGWGYAAVYQVLRASAAILFLLVVYRLCTLFLSDRLMRRTAFLVITFTSGFGWVLVLMKYTVTGGELLFPLDVFIAEGNTFLGILGYPHFIAAGLYVLAFDLVLRGKGRGGGMRLPILAGLLVFILGWSHAYDLLLVYGVLGAYVVLLTLRDRRLPAYETRALVVIVLVSFWPALYSLALTSLHPVWKEVLGQFANAGVYTPSPLHLPLLLGVAFLLALFTALKMNPLRLRGVQEKQLFLQAWFWSNMLMIYIPTDFQIHMLNGWQVPIGILATQGAFRYVAPALGGLAQRAGRAFSAVGLRKAVAVGLLLAVIPTNVYLWTWRFVDLGRYDYPYYLSDDEVQALSWLEANATEEDVVLSSLTLGQYIPFLTGGRAFLAHWAQTLDFFGKRDIVEGFYSGAVEDGWREEILRRYSVDYVFYGPAEKALGGYTPDRSPLLRAVFTAPTVDIYAVLLEPGACAPRPGTPRGPRIAQILAPRSVMRSWK